MAEASLDQVVELAKRAAAECSRRAERFLTEVNPSPAVAKSITEGNHKRRRDDAYDKCMDAAASVLAQCPEPEGIRQLVRETEESQKRAAAAKAAGNTTADASSNVVFHEPHFQLRRCETVVSSFVSVLFWMANAPTRYELEMKDFHEQRKQEKIGAYADGTKNVVKSALGKKNLPPGMNSGYTEVGGGDNKSISEIVGDRIAASSGGQTSGLAAGGAWMDQKDEHGIPIRPGTGHLSKEQRQALEELAQGSDPGKVQVWGGSKF